MMVMDGDGQEMEATDSGFVTYSDADIAVCGRHVRCLVERDRERSALP